MSVEKLDDAGAAQAESGGRGGESEDDEGDEEVVFSLRYSASTTLGTVLSLDESRRQEGRRGKMQWAQFREFPQSVWVVIA